MTAIATFVGVIAFGFALFEFKAKERAEEIKRWQRVVVYNIIREANDVTFPVVKQRYVTESTQLQSLKLPSKEIQDDALRAVLLDLQRDKVVYLVAGGIYRPTVEIPNTTEDLFKKYAVQEITRQQSVQNVTGAVLRLIGRESGQHTIDELIRRCHR